MLVAQFLILLCITLSSGGDYYELLGIPKDANDKQIRKAFKKLAVTLHPDKNKDDPEAHNKFIKLTRAYEVLKDNEMRKRYDLHGEEDASSRSQSQYHSYTYYRDYFGIYDDDPEVITLNTGELESILESSKQWFVNFYSPLCSHCHDLAPIWRRLAVELKGVVMFGAINCEEEWVLCRQQKIRSYPSLVMYPQKTHYEGSRTMETLEKYILESVSARIWDVTDTSELTSLTDNENINNWILLLCHMEERPDCLEGDELIKLAAMMNNLMGVAVLDCKIVPETCSQFHPGDNSNAIYWQRSKDGKSFSTRTINSDTPKNIAQEVLNYLPELDQLDADLFKEMVRQMEPLSDSLESGWLIYFYIGADADLDIELRKLPPMLSITSSISVGRLNCARFAEICQEYSISRYPSFAVFKPGGGYEFFHGTPTVVSIAQFARESARATNIRTLSQQLFPQLVTHPTGENSAWFIDFYAPWCPPCLRLLPELRKASSIFKSTGVKAVRFGTVDCTIHAELCRHHNIRSYPTTMLFNHSQPSLLFKGDRSANGIATFIKEIIDPKVVKLTIDNFHSKIFKRSELTTWIVDFFVPWCVPCQLLRPEWRKLERLMDEKLNVLVGEVNCEEEYELCQDQGVRSYPTIRLYPAGSDTVADVITYNGMQRDANSLRQWVFNYLPSDVIELTPDLYHLIKKGPEYWLVNFYAPWCGHCHTFTPQFSIIAKHYKGVVKCGKLNCQEHHILCQSAGVTGYPTVMIFDKKSDYKGVEIPSQMSNIIINYVNKRLHPSYPTHEEL